jgi:hypothetical protein
VYRRAAESPKCEKCPLQIYMTSAKSLVYNTESIIINQVKKYCIYYDKSAEIAG